MIISARFQRILDIFDHAQHGGAISNIVRCRTTSSRQPEIAMADYKPEVVITHDRNEIAAKSQRLAQHFRPWPTHWNIPTVSDVGRQPEFAMAAKNPPLLWLLVG